MNLPSLTGLNALFTEGTVWNNQGVLYYEGTELKQLTVEGVVIQDEEVTPDGITDTFSTAYPFSSITVRINGLEQDPSEVTMILNELTGQSESYQLIAVPQSDYSVTHTYVRTANKKNINIIFT